MAFVIDDRRRAPDAAAAVAAQTAAIIGHHIGLHFYLTRLHVNGDHTAP